LFEEVATEQLIATRIRPRWLIWAAVALTLGGAACFSRGWLGAGLAMLVLSTPLDLVAKRLAALRLRPLPIRMISRLALWPAAGLALLALGWWEMRNGGWGTFLAAASTLAFAEAARIEQAPMPPDSELWLFSRRSAIFAAIPFALGSAWIAYLIALLIYAATSFFIVQQVRHQQAG